MIERIQLPHGVLLQDTHEAVMEIPLGMTNVQEEEQLSELRKEDSFFLKCIKQELTEGKIYLSYELPSGFRPLRARNQESLQKKQKIAKNILKIKQIQGTQFTTYIHPDNIYSNEEGEVKFVHRGIRALLPPEQDNGKEFIFQMKCLLLSLFTGKSFFELLEKNLTTIPIQNAFIEKLAKAKSFSEMEQALSMKVQERKQVPEKKIKKPTPAVPVQSKAEKATAIDTKVENKRIKLETPVQKWGAALGILVFGLLAGTIITYLVQVKPGSSALAASNQDKSQLKSQLEQAENEKEAKEQILAGYKMILAGESEEAIKALEAAGDLSDEEKKVLAQQYVELNTPESLSKAANLDSELHGAIASKLVSLNTDDAKKALLSLKSDSPVVQIEQAWLGKEDDRIIKIFSEQLKDDKRAKKLAAHSYLRQEKINESFRLAVELKDVALQIAVKNKQIAMINSDGTKTQKEKEEQIKVIQKEIENINKANIDKKQ
ncbi:type VII secretion protein EssB/YukC [Cytobacillus massiliigabonensis]|uniref:type VII secretion protein EssB/YukC n=1 Tax=Cytobacillus massiliigabonensis TaxID=1871011 RepID=UPI0015E0D097|nr:type VII secretion protein EssB/YukC [Cytobacillus massiliigabonensis]